jgi:outer membrane protein TolC
MNSTNNKPGSFRRAGAAAFLLAALAMPGCRGVPTAGENQARQQVNDVTSAYRPGGKPMALPELTTHSSLADFLRFAMLNHPVVEAAYYDWVASVENITITRSRSDPQFTFQAYITDRLTSLMPGLNWSIPGPGKLAARGRVATEASAGKYFAFESAVLQTAFNLKSSYYKLSLVEEQIRLNRETLSLLDHSEHVTRALSQSGQATSPDVLRVQSDIDRVRNALADLEDSRQSLLANFKAALGLTPEQADPPVPAQFDMGDQNIAPDDLLRTALENNPQLKAMAADVETAEASMAVAYKDRVPDFNAGLQAEVYEPPFFWPQAGVTLPIWRDKLAAEVAQAKANELAAKSRLTSAQIDLAVSFAEKAFTCRETSRNLALVEDKLVPKARQSIDLIRAGYQTGTADYASLTDAERMLLTLKLEAAEARTQRAIALADLSLIVAGVPPSGAPLLSNAHQR